MNRLTFLRSLLAAPFAAKALARAAPAAAPLPTPEIREVTRLDETDEEMREKRSSSIGTALASAAAGALVAVKMFDGETRWQAALHPVVAGQLLVRGDVTCQGFSPRGNYDLETLKRVV